MAVFEPRLSSSGIQNRYYTRVGYTAPDTRAGVNECIIGYPTQWNGSVLSNCVGYAWGRAYEIMAKMGIQNPRPDLSINNAWRWYADDRHDNYERGSQPRLGAICCFDDNSDSYHGGGGHVAVVEQITETSVILSNSAYSGTMFYLTEYDKNSFIQGQPHHASSHGGWYIFQGFIYLPIDTPVPPPPPITARKLKIMFYPHFF